MSFGISLGDRRSEAEGAVYATKITIHLQFDVNGLHDSKDYTKDLGKH